MTDASSEPAFKVLHIVDAVFFFGHPDISFVFGHHDVRLSLVILISFFVFGYHDVSFLRFMERAG